MKKPMTEDQAIELAQGGFADLKAGLKKIQEINTAEGRLEAANAAMLLYGKAVVLHGEATEALYLHYPSKAGGVVALGGGGR